jgi:hypothetical protein
MPRRNRRETSAASPSEDEGELYLEGVQERILGPGSARLEGFEVRRAVNKLKRYRCPYCEGWVEPGSHHIVALPAGTPDARRHFHTGCWSKHARTLARGVRP